MISRYYGTLDQSCAQVEDVYDYEALESLDEFRQVAGPAEVIMIVDTASDGQAVVFGKDVLEEIIRTGVSKSPRVITFAFDFASQWLEHCIAAVSVVKGRHDYAPD